MSYLGINPNNKSTVFTGTSGSSVPLLNASNTWTGTQTLNAATLNTPDNLSIVSNLVSMDLSVGNNFSLKMSGNATLQNPINIQPGMSGQIRIQNGSTPYTLAFGSSWKFPNGTAPSLTQIINAVDILVFYTDSNSTICANLIKNEYIGAGVNQPTLTYPTNNATGISLTPTLTSSAFSSINSDTQLASQWQISTNSGFISTVYDSGTDATHLTSITIPTLSYGIQYYARMRQQGTNDGWSAWSPTVIFNTLPAF